MLLLGAGASVTSGVDTVDKMVAGWRKQYRAAYDGHDDIPIEKMSWYETDEEYSKLFELLYDHPSQRREYIESCITTASPSWGYIYLVNLIAENVFRTLLTTNFDDLLNEACYMFSGHLRPIVCAHDSSIRSVRVTSKRPQIVKLHGDFLFDNIKNTTSELESLENNTRGKFKQYAAEYGMIVVGYSGRDRSVMDTVNSRLRSDDAFPHGVYWCLRKGDEIPAVVHELSAHPKVELVEIDGFDEFFAEMHDFLGLTLQKEMSDPYGALTARLDNLIGRVNIPEEEAHAVIERDIRQLAQKLVRAPEQLPGEEQQAVQPSPPDDSSLPLSLLAQVSLREGRVPEARQYIDRQLTKEPNAASLETAFRIARSSEDEGFAKELIEILKKSPSMLRDRPGIGSEACLALVRLGLLEDAEQALRLGEPFLADWRPIDIEYWTINLAQVLRRRDVDFDEDLGRELETIAAGSPRPMSCIGAQIVLKRYSDARAAINALDRAARDVLMGWPIYDLMPSVDTEE